MNRRPVGIIKIKCGWVHPGDYDWGKGAILMRSANSFFGSSKPEQAQTLWDKGVHLGERSDSGHRIMLYQIDAFCIEVFYDRDDNTIKRLRNFWSTGQLRPNLEQIDISRFI